MIVGFTCRHSRQSSGLSSELSPQSSSPSHFQASGLHRVLLHWNSSKGQRRPAERTLSDSEFISVKTDTTQSHAQNQSWRIRKEQEKKRIAHSPAVWQSSSSLPSMQSGSASHRQRIGIQCPFLHWNWSLSHLRSQPSWRTQPKNKNINNASVKLCSCED